jgi:hypothetical protein
MFLQKTRGQSSPSFPGERYIYATAAAAALFRKGLIQLTHRDFLTREVVSVHLPSTSELLSMKNVFRTTFLDLSRWNPMEHRLQALLYPHLGISLGSILYGHAAKKILNIGGRTVVFASVALDAFK